MGDEDGVWRDHVKLIIPEALYFISEINILLSIRRISFGGRKPVFKSIRLMAEMVGISS